jgi:hypothetical protein
MSEHEKEDSVHSGLPYPIKLIGMLIIVGLAAGPPLWACIQAGNLLGIFISLLLADVIAKIVWRLC